MVLASSHGASVIKLAACPAEPGSSAGQATLFGVSPGQLPAEHDGWRSRSACSRTSQKTGAESCAHLTVFALLQHKTEKRQTHFWDCDSVTGFSSGQAKSCAGMYKQKDRRQATHSRMV
jgi:hypothetical protein